MKNKLLLLVMCLTTYVNAQTSQQHIYTKYRTRLNTKFVVVGQGSGQGIPVSEHKSLINNDSLNHWGDATIALGWYIGVLATEFEVNRLNNKSNANTVTELYYAINTLNRLDSIAEPYFGGTSSLNGFFVRDDVSPAMIPATNLTQPFFFNADNCVASNYPCGSSYCLPLSTTPCIGALNNEESQDQFYHLLLGLSLCSKYANVVYNGLNLSVEAKAITNRLITYIKTTNWVIKNPVNGNNVTRGENTTAYSYGIAKAGLNITGINYSDAITNGLTATLTWSSFPTINFTVGSSLTADNVHMFLATACVANDARQSVDAYATLYNMPIYPLIRQVLYNGPNTINDTVYTNLLNKIDSNGSYYYSPTAKSTGGTWYNENIFVWPNRSMAAASGTNTLSFTFGEYAGLDFMLLHNLMQLKQITNGITTTKTPVGVNLYPNPNNGEFTIALSDLTSTTNYQYCIYNALGQQVEQASLNKSSNNIALNNVRNGIYLVVIKNNGEVVFKRTISVSSN